MSPPPSHSYRLWGYSLRGVFVHVRLVPTRVLVKVNTAWMCYVIIYVNLIQSEIIQMVFFTPFYVCWRKKKNSTQLKLTESSALKSSLIRSSSVNSCSWTGSQWIWSRSQEHWTTVQPKHHDTHTFTHSLTPWGNLSEPVYQLAPVHFWRAGGNRRTWKKPLRTQREHMKLHTVSNPSSWLNPRPCSSKAAVHHSVCLSSNEIL